VERVEKGRALVSVVEPSPSQVEAAKHRVKAKLLRHLPNGRGLEKTTRLVESGRLKVFVNPLFSLAEVKRARQISQLGHTCGKNCAAGCLIRRRKEVKGNTCGTPYEASLSRGIRFRKTYSNGRLSIDVLSRLILLSTTPAEPSNSPTHT
jgi:Zinc-binding dehydrogenase